MVAPSHSSGKPDPVDPPVDAIASRIAGHFCTVFCNFCIVELYSLVEETMPFHVGWQ